MLVSWDNVANSCSGRNNYWNKAIHDPVAHNWLGWLVRLVLKQLLKCIKLVKLG